MHMGMPRQMMDYFEKAYFFYERTQNFAKA